MQTFLKYKKQIILTHNTELIKLLEFQNNSSFELYLFNNKSGSKNGFINVSNKEKELLLKLNKLLDLLRGNRDNTRGNRDNIKDFIKEGNEKLFLISMIPFMRGYANMIGESDIYSLEEYNTRFDQKIDKAYLEGRYGGVPIFNTIFPMGED